MLLQALGAKVAPKFAGKASDLMLANSARRNKKQSSCNYETNHSSTLPEDAQSGNSSFASIHISSCTPEEKVKPKFAVKETQRLITLSNEILEILTVLDPGHSVNKGRVLKELIVPILKLSQYEFDMGEIDEVEFKTRKVYCSKLTKDVN